jgi:hypothetical protein
MTNTITQSEALKIIKDLANRNTSASERVNSTSADIALQAALYTYQGLDVSALKQALKNWNETKWNSIKSLFSQGSKVVTFLKDGNEIPCPVSKSGSNLPFMVNDKPVNTITAAHLESILDEKGPTVTALRKQITNVEKLAKAVDDKHKDAQQEALEAYILENADKLPEGVNDPRSLVQHFKNDFVALGKAAQEGAELVETLRSTKARGEALQMIMAFQHDEVFVTALRDVVKTFDANQVAAKLPELVETINAQKSA